MRVNQSKSPVTNRRTGKFTQPNRPIGKRIEGRVVLPGSFVRLKNRYKFTDKINTVLEKMPLGTIDLFLQPSINDPSNLISLNFYDHFQSVREISPFHDFVLVVRAGGKRPLGRFNIFSKRFNDVFPKYKFLLTDSKSSDAPKKADPYNRSLADTEAPKRTAGPSHGGGRPAKDVVNDEKTRGEDNNETTDLFEPDNAEANERDLFKTMGKRREGFFRTNDGEADYQPEEL